MDVIVDQVVAILKVLPLGYAVGADQDVQLSRIIGHDLVLLFGAGGKERQDGLEVIVFLERGSRIARSGDNAAVNILRLGEMRRELIEQVVRGIGIGGENDHLAVAGVQRVGHLSGDLGN